MNVNLHTMAVVSYVSRDSVLNSVMLPNKNDKTNQAPAHERKMTPLEHMKALT